MSKCRSCGAKIIWIITPAGKKMPCDPEPVYFKPAQDGELRLVTANGTIARGTKAEKAEDALCGYVSHFATCPNADKHRRR